MEALLALPPDIPVAAACRALGASRATLYRLTGRPAIPKPRPTPHRALRDDERAHVLEVLHSPEHVDRTPREVAAALLSVGVYLCSVRTMYRLLAASAEVRERRRGHVAGHHAMPSLVATAPNQVWTWDITKVPGLERGVFFFVYVLLDLFSRYVVGWLASDRESAENAVRLVEETVHVHGIEPGALTLHSDRGSPMTAGSMTQLLATLSIERSLSRPRVSNDNPFVESHFKTAKYQPHYPGRFCSLLHVRGYFGTFLDWYNGEHHHEGLAMFTPGDVFHDRVTEVAAVRQAALDAAFAARPERFVGGRPVVRLPPARVHINSPEPGEVAAPNAPTDAGAP